MSGSGVRRRGGVDKTKEKDIERRERSVRGKPLSHTAWSFEPLDKFYL